MKIRAFLPLLIALTAAGIEAQTPRTHRLEATPATVAYGHYWAETKPVLTINSGDIIDVDTMLTSTPDRLEKAGVPANEIQQSLRDIVEQVKDRGPGGHILTGPVFVTGAEPGDALEVKVLSIDLPIGYGYNGCSGFIRENCVPGRGPTILRLDRKNMTSEFLPGIVIPLKPFFGSMGVAPEPSLGRVSSNPPSRHAGNLDNRELVAGSTLYIPVFVKGALFEVGDGHAAQGDGELTGDALETSMDIEFTVDLIRDRSFGHPLAENADFLISIGIAGSIDQALQQATSGMVRWLDRDYGLNANEAAMVLGFSVKYDVVDLVGTQVSVAAKVPKTALAKMAKKPTL